MTIILIIGKYNGHFLYLAYKELRINILIIRRKSNYRSVFDYNPFYWNLVPIIILYKYVIDK